MKKVKTKVDRYIPISKKAFLINMLQLFALLLILIAVPLWPPALNLLGILALLILTYLSFLAIYATYLRKKTKREELYDSGIIIGTTSLKTAGGTTSHLLGTIDSLKTVGVKKILVIFTTDEGSVATDIVKSVRDKGADVAFVPLSPNLFSTRTFKEVKELTQLMSKSKRFIFRLTDPLLTQISFMIKVYFAKVASCTYIAFEVRRLCESSKNFAIVPLATKLIVAIKNCMPSFGDGALPCLLFDELYCVSETDKELLIKDTLLCKLFKEKVKATYTPPKSYEPKERGKEGVVCFSGTFMGHHGADELLLFLKEVKRRNLKIKLRLYAPDANLFHLFKYAAEKYGLSDLYERVYIRDWKEYMEDMDKNCSILLVPYSDLVKIDPFFGAPSKLSEFILLKRPIILWSEEEYVRSLRALAKTNCAFIVKDYREAVDVVEKILKEGIGECQIELKESPFVKTIREFIQKEGKCTNKHLSIPIITALSMNEVGVKLWGLATYLTILHSIYRLFKTLYQIYRAGTYYEKYVKKFWEKVERG